MPKRMCSFSVEIFSILQSEAKSRGNITIQELLRAVIVPEWFKDKEAKLLEKAFMPKVR